MQTRHKRYRHLYDDPDSPVRTDLVDYHALFREPLYQLMRQQLLAWRMEVSRELGADRVRLLVVAPSRNHELASSYDASLALQVGAPEDASVHAVWRCLLRRPDRFVVVDGAEFVAADAPGSADFKDRYGHIGVAGESPFSVPTGDDLRAAAAHAQMILARVGNEGGVLSQFIELDDRRLASLDPVQARLLLDRLQHIAEDVRRLRAEELFGGLE